MTILPKQQAERGDDGDGRPPGVGPRPRASPTPPAPGGLALAGASSSSSCGPSAGGSSSSASSSSSSSSAAAEDGACQASASISSSNPSSAGGGGSSGPAGSCPSGSASCSSSSSSPGSGSPCTGEGSSGSGGSGLGACCSSSCSGQAQAQAAASHWQLLQEPAASPYPRHHRRHHHHHHHHRHHKRRHRASPHRSGRMSLRGAGGPPTPGPGPPLGLHPHHLLHYRRPQASPSPPGGGGGGGAGGGGGGGAGGRGGLLHHLLQQHRRRLLQQHRRRLSPRGDPEEDEEEDDNDDDDEGAGPGYNSEDEYETAAREQQQQLLQDPAKLEQQEHWFEKALSEKKGFVIKRMKEDGACLFRAVADQVYGDQDMHDVVRKHCMDYLVKNADYFSNYVTEDFATYVSRKRVSSCHGNHIEMQAMAEMYNRPVEVYQYSMAGEENVEPINTFHGIHQTEDEPIRVSYHRNIHYNSVVNPNKATIGVGLGLPAFKPGSADQSLMKNAIKTSEESWIEQQMLEDKKRATDWEATNEAIEEQVARESYLQWLRDQEKQPRKASATCSSATAAASSGLEEWTGRSPRQRSLASSPEHSELHADPSGKPPSPGNAVALGLVKPPSPCAPGTSSQLSMMGERALSPTVSFCPALDCRAIMQQMSPTAFGLADWEDDEILASVLAVSQQEYLDSMKKGRESYREYSPDRS